MDNSKFFQVIWRINAILMLLALVLGLVKIGYDELYKRSHQPTYSDTYNYSTFGIDESSESIRETRWRYGRLNKVTGESRLVLELTSELRNENDSIYLTRNILFINAELGNSWLRSHNNSSIWNHEFLTTEAGEVLAVIYDIAECMNNECTDWSKTAIYLSRTDSSELTKIVDQASRRIGHEMLDDHHLVILYVQDEIAYAAKVSLIDFAVIENIALSQVE